MAITHIFIYGVKGRFESDFLYFAIYLGKCLKTHLNCLAVALLDNIYLSLDWFRNLLT